MLSLKTDVNVPTESMHNLFFFGILKASDEKSRIRICNAVYGSKDPDQSQNVTDP